MSQESVQRLKEELKGAANHLQYALDACSEAGLIDDEETEMEQEDIDSLRKLAND